MGWPCAHMGRSFKHKDVNRNVSKCERRPKVESSPCRLKIKTPKHPRWWKHIKNNENDRYALQNVSIEPQDMWNQMIVFEWEKGGWKDLSMLRQLDCQCWDSHFRADQGYTVDGADACWGSGDRTGGWGPRWQRSVNRFTKLVLICLSTGVEPRPNLTPGHGCYGQSLEERRHCTGLMETT